MTGEILEKLGVYRHQRRGEHFTGEVKTNTCNRKPDRTFTDDSTGDLWLGNKQTFTDDWGKYSTFTDIER